MPPRKGSSEADSRGPGPPHRGPGPPASVRTSHAVEPTYRRGVRSRHVSRRHGRGLVRESSARRLAHPLHLMRMVEACSVAAARGTAFVRPLCAPHITKVHSAATCAAPNAEPVCRINWIRRHDAFPSCRLRRKLHGPFSYVAGDAASYAWCRFDKTAPGRAGKEIQERDLLRLQ